MNTDSTNSVDREYAKICLVIERLAENHEILPSEGFGREHLLRNMAKLIVAMSDKLTEDERTTLMAMAALVRRQSMARLHSEGGAS